MTQERDTGLALFEAVYGKEMAKGIGDFIASSDSFGVKQAEWTLDWTFGSIWARPGIERKMRSCAVLGMLIALRAVDEIKAHTLMGLANGLSRKDPRRDLLHRNPLCGLPVRQRCQGRQCLRFSQRWMPQPIVSGSR